EIGGRNCVTPLIEADKYRRAMPPSKRAPKNKVAETYLHPEADLPMRPEVGTQAQFKKKKPPVTYRYDSSLSPALDWDGQNPAREQGEQHVAAVEKRLADAHAQLADARQKLTKAGQDGPLAEQLKSATQNLAAATEANQK